MPLGLLLQGAFGTWRRDVSRLTGWPQLVDLEQTLLGRARGGFLARWFGSALPMTQGCLRIAIANLDELSAHYRALRRRAIAPTDLNLTEPIAGIAGTLAGALLAPPSSMALMVAVAKALPHWLITLAAVLNWLTFGGLGVLLFAIGVPVAAAGLPLAALAFHSEVGTVHSFLGVLARLFAAAGRFLGQIIGPRDQVRNPLLSALLTTLDHVAGVVPFVFALAAFVVLWVGPQLAPLAAQLDLLIPMARTVLDVVAAVLTNLMDRLRELYVGKQSPWAILQHVIGTFRRLFTIASRQFGALFGIVKPAFDSVTVVTGTTKSKEIRAWLEIKRALRDAFKKVLPFIKEMTTESWLVKQIKEIGKRFQKITEIFGSIETTGAKPKEGLFSKLATAALPPFPPAPKIPDFPSAEEIFNRQEWEAALRWEQPDIVAAFTRPEGGHAFVWGADASKALERLRKPPIDVFAAERKALQKLEPSEAALGEAQARQAQLESMLFAVMDNLLPTAVAEQVPKLQARLWELDELLYGKKGHFPVRDLPGPDDVNLKVAKVRVRAPGMPASGVRAWGKDLRTALEHQRYRAAIAAPAAAGA